MSVNYYAQKALLRSRIKTLPVSSDDIRNYLEKQGWVFVIYDIEDKESEKMLKRLNVYETARLHKGFSYKKGSVKLVFFRGHLSEIQRLIVFAHELGHIELNHFSVNGILGYVADGMINDEHEQEANEFSAYFLAPPCIIKKTKHRRLKDIQKNTNIPNYLVGYVYEALEDRTKTSNIERQLQDQFCAFFSSKIGLFMRYLIKSVLYDTLNFIKAIGSSDYALNRNGKKMLHGNIVPLNFDEKTMALVTKKGKRYHKAGCPKTMNKWYLEAITIPAAEVAGYKPCAFCMKEKVKRSRSVKAENIRRRADEKKS